jgi:hypothetical protein
MFDPDAKPAEPVKVKAPKSLDKAPKKRKSAIKPALGLAPPPADPAPAKDPKVEYAELLHFIGDRKFCITLLENELNNALIRCCEIRNSGLAQTFAPVQNSTG